MVDGVQNRPQAGAAAPIGGANQADAAAQTGELNGRQVRQEQAQPRQANFLTRAFNQVRNFLSRLFGGARQQPAQPRNAPPVGNEQRPQRAPKPLSREQVQDSVMRLISAGSHHKFSEAVGIKETGRDGYSNHQDDVINKNPIMGQVIEKFDALNNEQPQQFRAVMANPENVIEQAIAFAEEIERGD